MIKVGKASRVSIRGADGVFVELSGSAGEFDEYFCEGEIGLRTLVGLISSAAATPSAKEPSVYQKRRAAIEEMSKEQRMDRELHAIQSLRERSLFEPGWGPVAFDHAMKALNFAKVVIAEQKAEITALKAKLAEASK